MIPSFQQISDTISEGLFGIDQPAIGNTLITKYGHQQLDWFSYMKSLGYMKPVGLNTYSFFTDDWWHQPFVVKTGATAVGGVLTVDIDPSTVDSSGRFYPQFGDTIMFTDHTTGIIMDVTGTTFTISTSTGTNPTVATGAKLYINGNSQSEGSTNQRKSIMHNKTK